MAAARTDPTPGCSAFSTRPPAWPAAKPTALDDSSVKETVMRVAVMYAPGDVRIEERPDPKILRPTDAILRLPASCICGSDLWPYRGADPIDEPTPTGHEYEIGRATGRE